MNAQNNQNNQNNQNKGGGLSWSQPARSSGENSFKSVGANKPTPQAAQKAPAAPASLSTTNNGGTSTRTLALLIAGAIVLGLLLGWAFFGSGERTPEGGTTTTSTEENTGGASTSTEEEQNGTGVSVGSGSAGRDSFTVPPTQPAGLTVAVSQASVSGNTWIVVYESANGERGNALGAALFMPEKASGVIRLLRTTVAGQTYFVGHHRDNGDRKFSLENDQPALGTDGEPVYVEFRAQ